MPCIHTGVRTIWHDELTYVHIMQGHAHKHDCLPSRQYVWTKHQAVQYSTHALLVDGWKNGPSVMLYNTMIYNSIIAHFDW